MALTRKQREILDFLQQARGFQAVALSYRGDELPGYIYARVSNPTVAMFEARMASMEGAEAARATLPFLALHGIHAVVGTTGFSGADLESFRSAFTGSNCLVAANFAIGAVLMMKFAEQAAPYFETAEIIEFHHNAKADAPSGTALATAQRMAAASSEWAADPTRHEVVPGARGGVGPGGIRVHGVRMVGMTASQEVILGTAGQTLVIRHDSNDRVSFMPGVVLACRRVAGLPDRLTLGIDSLL